MKEGFYLNDIPFDIFLDYFDKKSFAQEIVNEPVEGMEGFYRSKNGLLTDKPTSRNNFYSHQKAMRNAFYNAFDNGWVNSPNITTTKTENNSIITIPKIVMVKYKDSEYFSYNLKVKKTISLEKLDSAPDSSVLVYDLPNKYISIVSENGFNTTSEISILDVPVYYRSINDIPIYSSFYIVDDDLDSEPEVPIIFKNGIKTLDGNIIIKFYKRSILFNNKSLKVDSNDNLLHEFRVFIDGIETNFTKSGIFTEKDKTGKFLLLKVENLGNKIEIRDNTGILLTSEVIYDEYNKQNYISYNNKRYNFYTAAELGFPNSNIDESYLFLKLNLDSEIKTELYKILLCNLGTEVEITEPNLLLEDNYDFSKDTVFNSQNSVNVYYDDGFLKTNKNIYYSLNKFKINEITNDISKIKDFLIENNEIKSYDDVITNTNPDSLSIETYYTHNTNYYKETILYEMADDFSSTIPEKTFNISNLASIENEKLASNNSYKTIQKEFAKNNLYFEDPQSILRGEYISDTLFSDKRKVALKNSLIDTLQNSDDSNFGFVLKDAFNESSGDIQVYNYSKALNSFIKKDKSLLFNELYLEKKILKDIDDINEKIVLKELASDSEFEIPIEESNYIKEHQFVLRDRALLERLVEADKYPMNFMAKEEIPMQLKDTSNITVQYDVKLNKNIEIKQYERDYKKEMQGILDNYINLLLKHIFDKKDLSDQLNPGNLSNQPTILSKHYQKLKNIIQTETGESSGDSNSNIISFTPYTLNINNFNFKGTEALNGIN